MGGLVYAPAGRRTGDFREDAKDRKGLGTSPFGPMGLTTVPIPCGSSVFPKHP